MTRATPMLRMLRFVALALLVAPAAARAQTPEVVYYHTDATGSVRMTTDANGDVIARYDYLPFGEEWPQQPPTTDPDVRQYAGKERDAETGLDYFGARYYRASSGRFTTVDPVTPVAAAVFDPQMWSRYVYVRNNPLRYEDPDGRCIIDLCIGEAAAVWAAAGVASAVTVWALSPEGRHAARAAWEGTTNLLAVGIANARDRIFKSESHGPRPRYEPNPKHGPERRGNVSAEPADGQSALDNSAVVKGTSPRRVGVDPGTGEIVVLDRTSGGVYHGHVRRWEELTDDMRNALIRNGITDKNGRPMQ